MIDETMRAAMHRDMAYRAAGEALAAARNELHAVEWQLVAEAGWCPTGSAPVLTGRGQKAARAAALALLIRRDELVATVVRAEDAQGALVRQADDARRLLVG